MGWYAASVIMYFKIKNEEQGEFSVWENVYLIEAPDGKRAWARAEELGKLEAGDDGGELRYAGKPAEQVFGGVRKVLTCAPSLLTHSEDNSKLEDGMEATYSSFIVKGQQELDALIRGKSVQVIYEEQEPYDPPTGASGENS